MEKNLLNDIDSPVRKRSIRDIPIPGERKIDANKKESGINNNSDINLRKVLSTNNERRESYESESSSQPVNNNKRHKSKKSNKKLYMIIGGVVVILFLIIIFMDHFAKVNVNLSVKSAEISINNLEIELIPIENNQNGTKLGYRKLDFNNNVKKEVEATHQELVQQKASGRIVVYNSHSPNNQNWIQNTRFQAPNKLIYRSPIGITIPGYTMSGDSIIPGEIEIEIVADEIGKEYNLSSGTKFTVPAFEGQDSFNEFYAKAITGLEGGFDGVRRIVSESDLVEAREQLQKDLRNALKQDVNNQIPDNLIALYPKDSFIFDPISQEDVGGDNVSLNLRGKVSVVVIDKDNLAAAIAQNQLNDYRISEIVSIKNFDDLEIILIEKDGDLFLQLSGDIVVIWDIDSDKLIADLIGKDQAQIRDILTEYRGVTAVSTEFAPFWRNSFPENPRKIIINKI